VLAEFDVKKDERNRVTLKGVAFDYYHAKVFDDGHIEFYPQVPAGDELSVHTISMMDSAMANFARGKIGEPLDPRIILGGRVEKISRGSNADR
jgi:hypothetical protein